MNFIGMRNFILDGGENLWEIGKSFFHAQAACALITCMHACNGY